MKEERAHAVVESAESSLRLAVLLTSIRAGETQDGAVGGKESACGVTVELATVVSLDREDRQLKLSASIGVEIA